MLFISILFIYFSSSTVHATTDNKTCTSVFVPNLKMRQLQKSYHLEGLLQSGKSQYRGSGSTACAKVNPPRKWLFVQKNIFLYF
jgi:hypothetical protein